MHTLSLRSYLLPGLLYVALLGMAHVFILPSATYAAHPDLLGAALLFDLTVWPLVAFYWLVARGRQWSVVRVGLVGVALLRLTMWWLPNVPDGASFGWPGTLLIVESTVLIVSILRAIIIVKTYRALRGTHDVPTALRGALAGMFGDRLAGLILFEGQVLYYALLAWNVPADVPAGATPLTSHRTSGQLAMLWGLLGISAIELVAVHLLLSRWWPGGAVWVTLVSAYGCLMVLSLINATRKRPSYRTADTLHLRLDLRWQATIPLSQIASITTIAERLPKQANVLNASLLVQPNRLITLREPITVAGLYGIKKTVTQVTVFWDDV
jgi:hypothetical protein